MNKKMTATTFVTLALALSACGGTTKDSSSASSAGTTSAAASSASASESASASPSASESSTATASEAANPFAASSSSAASSSASPSVSISSSSSTTPSAAETSSAEATAAAIPENTGLDPASLPEDITFSLDKAQNFRPETIGIYKLDGAYDNPEGGKNAVYKYFEDNNPFTFTIIYRPNGSVEAGLSSATEQVKLGNGACGILLDSANARSVDCRLPVKEGGVIEIHSIIYTDNQEAKDLHYQYFVRASADFANQAKD